MKYKVVRPCHDISGYHSITETLVSCTVHYRYICRRHLVILKLMISK